jgi:hypothetical protein
MLAFALLASCSSESPADAGEPSCVEPLPVGCAPLYPPTFDNVFDTTLSKTCASGGGSCHGASGNNGGLTFANADEAYSLLASRISAGDPGCSKLVVRLESAGQPWGMPPGAPLSEGERCAIEQWIVAGAKR